MILRPYQLAAVAAIEAEHTAGRHALLVLPTGTGKTATFSAVIRRALERGARRVLVLAHTTELVLQAIARIQRDAPDLSVGRYQAHRRQTWARVIVASVASCTPRRLPELPTDEVDLVVIDEAHHATPGSRYAAVIDACSSARALLVTATPARKDRQGFGWILDRVAYAMSLPAAIDAGYLVRPREYEVSLHVDLGGVRLTHDGDYDAEALAAVMDAPECLAELVTAWQAHGEGRPTVAFVPSVAMAERLAQAFDAAGVPATWVCGDARTCPADVRTARLADYAARRARVIVNVGVLTEGWDDPGTSCLLMVRPTRSAALHTQMVGRGLRLAPGKHDCLVLYAGGALPVPPIRTADLRDPTIEELEAELGLREPEEELTPAQAQMEWASEPVTVAGHTLRPIVSLSGAVWWHTCGRARVACLDAGSGVVLYDQAGTYYAVSTAGGKLTAIAQGADSVVVMRAAELYAVAHGAPAWLVPGRHISERPAVETRMASVRRLARETGSRDVPESMTLAESAAWHVCLDARRLYRAR
jgi:superfamily II DNA or RNA helicase